MDDFGNIIGYYVDLIVQWTISTSDEGGEILAHYDTTDYTSDETQG